MRNNLKKWLAAILCIAMVLTLLPASLAEQDDPETPTLTPADDRDAEKADRIAPGFVDLTLSEEPSDNSSGFDGAGFPQSALTAALMRGVGARYPDGGYKGGMPADTDSNGEITLKELYTYSYNAVYGWTENVSGEGYSGPQHVQYYGPDGEILFRRK